MVSFILTNSKTPPPFPAFFFFFFCLFFFRFFFFFFFFVFVALLSSISFVFCCCSFSLLVYWKVHKIKLTRISATKTLGITLYGISRGFVHFILSDSGTITCLASGISTAASPRVYVQGAKKVPRRKKFAASYAALG